MLQENIFKLYSLFKNFEQIQIKIHEKRETDKFSRGILKKVLTNAGKSCMLCKITFLQHLKTELAYLTFLRTFLEFESFLRCHDSGREQFALQLSGSHESTSS